MKKVEIKNGWFYVDGKLIIDDYLQLVVNNHNVICNLIGLREYNKSFQEQTKKLTTDELDKVIGKLSNMLPLNAVLLSNGLLNDVVIDDLTSNNLSDDLTSNNLSDDKPAINFNITFTDGRHQRCNGNNLYRKEYLLYVQNNELEKLLSSMYDDLNKLSIENNMVKSIFGSITLNK